MGLSDYHLAYLKTVLWSANASTTEIWKMCGNRFSSKVQLRQELELLYLEGKLDRMREGRDWVWILPG